MDLVDIARVARLLSDKGERALERLFTEQERRYCEGKAGRDGHFAARVAAKEAVFKALSGTESARAIGWREIEVCVGADGKPQIALHARAAKRAAELRVSHIWVSLTHTGETAAAVAVLETSE